LPVPPFAFPHRWPALAPSAPYVVEMEVRDRELEDYLNILSGLPGGIANANTAAGALSGATDQYVAGSALAIGARQKAGTVLRWRLSYTKTAAGVATPLWKVLFGTNGSAADTARLTYTGVAQTAAADTGFVEIEVIVRSISATGTVAGVCIAHHHNTTTGLADKAQAQIFTATSAAFDNTAAGLYAGLTINPGAAGVWSVVSCSAEAINLN